MTVQDLIETYCGYRINKKSLRVQLDDYECTAGLILSDVRFASKQVLNWGFTEDHRLGIDTYLE